MKLGYGNYGMPHTPAETMLRQVAEIGYDGVELCVGPQYPTAPDRLGTADRRRLRAGLLERGLEVSSFMVTGLKLLEPEPAQHKANLDALRRTFELAADLEISSPIVTGTLGGRIEDWPALCPLLAQRVADWAAVAEECGANFCTAEWKTQMSRAAGVNRVNRQTTRLGGGLGEKCVFRCGLCCHRIKLSLGWMPIHG